MTVLKLNNESFFDINMYILTKFAYDCKYVFGRGINKEEKNTYSY